MTVEQLIDLLSSVKDKKMKVVLNASGEPFDVIGIDVYDKLVWIES